MACEPDKKHEIQCPGKNECAMEYKKKNGTVIIFLTLNIKLLQKYVDCIENSQMSCVIMKKQYNL